MGTRQYGSHVFSVVSSQLAAGALRRIGPPYPPPRGRPLSNWTDPAGYSPNQRRIDPNRFPPDVHSARWDD
jgi:hypothetical protein